MANHKQQQLLHVLLKEDQEPFLLKNYIADRRFQLKRPSSKTQLQVKKHKSSQNFTKQACFFSFYNPTCSPDPTKSPLFQNLHSPATKSPCKAPNTIFLHIPARTAAILLEAALRIQKQSTTSKTKNSNAFGLFGSFLKRITSRNKPRKLVNNVENIKKSVKDEELLSRIGRNSSAVWSESNNGENNSLELDLETSSSSCDHDECESLVAREFASFDHHENFCDSPFHFVLRRSPSPGHRTPEVMLSPVSSPSTTHHHHQFQEKENNKEVESLKKLLVDEEEEEEEKEQCSPVSVLDPPFVDDDDGQDDPCEEDGFDLECSYAVVQKTKQQLLAKLRRFEKLAELDPVELEKRILEHETDGESSEDDQLVPSHDIEVIGKMIIDEIISKPRLNGLSRVPKDMKRLVSDLINEEQKEQNSIACEDEAIVKRVCNRLESWKEVESNTIDMMVDQDFKKEHRGWEENQENVKETAAEIELAIFGILVDELSEELIGFNGWY